MAEVRIKMKCFACQKDFVVAEEDPKEGSYDDECPHCKKPVRITYLILRPTGKILADCGPVPSEAP